MVNIENWKHITEELARKNVTLIAVSKTKPATDIQELYNAGQRDFGENYVQELIEKQPALPQDIRWHFIGHLQSNKVKYIAPFVHLVHGIDNLKLLQEVNKQAAKHSRVIDVLLQFYIAEEESKFGMDETEIRDCIAAATSLPNIRIRGLMGMATNTDNLDQVGKEFHRLTSFFDTLKTTFFSNNSYFDTRSMGMSGDYALAIAQGSNMVRIGSLLFGARTYNK
jgi:pyridoxal phosphate enzyme (YggS family)